MNTAGLEDVRMHREPRVCSQSLSWPSLSFMCILQTKKAIAANNSSLDYKNNVHYLDLDWYH